MDNIKKWIKFFIVIIILNILAIWYLIFVNNITKNNIEKIRIDIQRIRKNVI